MRVGYDVYGAEEPTIVLLTSWAITHVQQWTAQVPYLARRFRETLINAVYEARP